MLKVLNSTQKFAFLNRNFESSRPQRGGLLRQHVLAGLALPLSEHCTYAKTLLPFKQHDS
jgi:hypothetical protein